MEPRTSFIIIGQDQQERARARLQVTSTGQADVVAELADGRLGLETIEKFDPHAALIILSGSNEQSLELIKTISRTRPTTGVICTGENCPPEDIVRAYRAGAIDFVRQPVEAEDLADVIAKIDARRQSSDPSSSGGQVVAVYSPRGGSGTTTVAVNLASAIGQRLQQRTALVDLNLQFGLVPLCFGLDPRTTIADAARHGRELNFQRLAGALTWVSEELYCLPAPAEIEEAFDVQPPFLKRMLSLLRTRFSQIVLDCGHQLDPMALTALDLADVILLVVSLDLPSIYNARRALDIFEAMGYPMEKVQVVLNRYDPEAGFPLKKVERALGLPLAAVFDQDPRAARASLNRRHPLMLSEAKSPLTQQYLGLARAITHTTDAGAVKKSGFWARLLKSLFGLKSSMDASIHDTHVPGAPARPFQPVVELEAAGL
jgi:pilus assembly protein CpaE